MLGVNIREQRLEYELCGLYDHERHTIILDPRLSDTQRLCTLAHELNHAQYEDSLRDHWISGKCERRARRNTALRLVSPLEYRLAECMFEGERFLMASDLGVTVHVLEDYQSLVLASASVDKSSQITRRKSYTQLDK